MLDNVPSNPLNCFFNTVIFCLTKLPLEAVITVSKQKIIHEPIASYLAFFQNLRSKYKKKKYITNVVIY